MIHYTILRPDGRMYRPRKPPRAILVGDDYDCVLVLGTHDLKLAQETAQKLLSVELGSDFTACSSERGWFEEKFRWGERTWIYNSERGQAGIMFNEVCDLGFAATAAHP